MQWYTYCRQKECIYLDTLKGHKVLTRNTKFAQWALKLIDPSLALCWAVQTVPNSAPSCEALIDYEKDQQQKNTKSMGHNWRAQGCTRCKKSLGSSLQAVVCTKSHVCAEKPEMGLQSMFGVLPQWPNVAEWCFVPLESCYVHTALCKISPRRVRTIGSLKHYQWISSSRRGTNFCSPTAAKSKPVTQLQTVLLSRILNTHLLIADFQKQPEFQKVSFFLKKPSRTLIPM